jgi:MFS family permease
MTKDLALTVTSTATTPPTTNTSRLSWATSLFYFGMLAGLYPMTFALQRFDIGRILGAVVIVWAVVCMLTAAVTTHQGLYVQRFFLGFVESVIPTGFMCVISGYYTQEEQALRQSWYVPCRSSGGDEVADFSTGGSLRRGCLRLWDLR